ncbi:MAG TPA: Hint domain-containing protein, partial [Chryseolinea sp.]|nr:Hint domain-containing protein [Chryseolinea sp.]
DAKNLADYNPMTAWIEGKSDYGIGEYFEVTGVNVNTIYNGYQSTANNWKNNSRVKRLKVYKDNKPLCLLDLTDEMGVQLFELPRTADESTISHRFRFKIVDVYKGLKYSDVAISEIQFTQCCMAGDTQILSASDPTDIAAIKQGNVIYGVDLISGTVTKSEILKVTKQIHLTVIKISTDSQRIEVTPNHPLYLKAYGFISIERYMQSKGLTNYQDLVNTTEVLTLHPETGEQVYKKISSIEEMHGVFETYSILKLSKGETYVANGFVTRTY